MLNLLCTRAHAHSYLRAYVRIYRRWSVIVLSCGLQTEIPVSVALMVGTDAKIPIASHCTVLDAERTVTETYN